MKFLYSLLSDNIIIGIAILSSLLCLSYIFQLFKSIKSKKKIDFFLESVVSEISHDENKARKGKAISILFHVLLIISLIFGSNYVFLNAFPTDDVHLMPDGGYCYYVEVTNNKNQTYTLPAEVYIYDGQYSVHRVYFDNGGYLNFGGRCSDYNLGEIAQGEDQKGREWTVVLTDRKAYHHLVPQTEPYMTTNDYLRFVLAGFQFFAVVLHLVSLFFKEES